MDLRWDKRMMSISEMRSDSLNKDEKFGEYYFIKFSDHMIIYLLISLTVSKLIDIFPFLINIDYYLLSIVYSVRYDHRIRFTVSLRKEFRINSFLIEKDYDIHNYKLHTANCKSINSR